MSRSPELKISNFSSRVEQDLQEELKQHWCKLFKMLLKNQFGVGHFNATKHSLSIELSNNNFIMTALNNLHSSLQSAFIEFLFTMECDWLPMLDILANSEDTVLISCVPNVINAYVSELFRADCQLF